MKQEVNHLIEYYSVLKRTASIIFRDEEQLNTNSSRLNLLNLGVSKAEDPEQELKRYQSGLELEDENSDSELLKGSGDSK